MKNVKEYDSSDSNWINELPLDEFENDNDDFTDMLIIDNEDKE
jgi:hypothetical protein